MSANSSDRQDDLFGNLFDKPAQQGPPMPEIVPEDPNAALWGDRWARKDINDANQKPYGRPDNPILPASAMTFDVKAAQEARDEAIDRSDENADPAWREAYYTALCDVARVKQEFTADDVWERLAEVDHVANTKDNRAAGGCVLRARRDGIIRLTDRVEPSRRKHCHRMLQRIYESLIFGQSETVN